MHIRCVLDALMLSMKRWARFPHSRTGYAPPLYSDTGYEHRPSASQRIQQIQYRYSALTADTVYSDAAYTLYSAIHSPSGFDPVCSPQYEQHQPKILILKDIEQYQGIGHGRHRIQYEPNIRRYQMGANTPRNGGKRPFFRVACRLGVCC